MVYARPRDPTTTDLPWEGHPSPDPRPSRRYDGWTSSRSSADRKHAPWPRSGPMSMPGIFFCLGKGSPREIAGTRLRGRSMDFTEGEWVRQLTFSYQPRVPNMQTKLYPTKRRRNQNVHEGVIGPV
ncbi:hypothetical protein HL42_5275 [Trichophyton rubrum]|nr:hypothetical protein HL42_5275 [Trichophyton rubrum]